MHETIETWQLLLIVVTAIYGTWNFVADLKLKELDEERKQKEQEFEELNRRLTKLKQENQRLEQQSKLETLIDQLIAIKLEGMCKDIRRLNEQVSNG